VSEPISVRARFERFPATLKGAFILRGEDADPHQVVLRQARAAGVGVSATAPVPLPSTTLDVAPHRDVFVPFELPVSDLDPGWYTLECDLEVDGTARTYDGGRRFSVPWPRAAVRRGQVKVDRRLAFGRGAAVSVEHVECVADSIRVHLRADPPAPFSARLSADGARLEVLAVEQDEGTGRATVTAYPLLRTHRLLRIEVRGKGRGAAAELDVRLP